MPTVEVIERVEETIKVVLPSMYKVLLHNDDVTTAMFVVSILVTIFYKTPEEAVELTAVIDKEGKGIAGAPYTFEVAAEKVIETIKTARANGFPLMASVEEL